MRWYVKRKVVLLWKMKKMLENDVKSKRVEKKSNVEEIKVNKSNDKTKN